ncbi:MAG: PAS domain S-box protein [Haloplanus sp.]
MTGEVILDTLRRINREMIRAESPTELKQAVCTVIAESTSYVFAWIGTRDETTGEIVPETSAGLEAGYLDDISITVDEGTTAQGPTGRAVRTRDVQVTQNVLDEPAYEPWRAQARDRGYQSSIAIPLLYEETLYGVLNVYADRPDAFEAREQELLAGMGETIGYALHNFEVQARQQQQYDNLFEHAPVMYVLTRDEGTPIVDDCNGRFLTKLGYEKDEVVERELADFYTAESMRRLHEDGYEQALNGEFRREKRDFVTADGDVLQTRMRAVPRVGADGDVIGTIVLYTDITEQKQAEAVLQHARALDASIDGIAIFNSDGMCVHANDAFVSLYDYDSSADVEGKSYDAFLADSELTRVEEAVPSALDERGTWRGETVGVRATGETFPAEVSIATVEDVGAVVIVRDVTDREERERQLRAERQRYRALTETAPDAIFVADPETRELVEANTRAEELTGYSQSELVGMRQSQLHPDEERYRQLFDTHIANSEASGAAIKSTLDDGSDVLIERKDGETRPVEISATLVEVGDEELFLGVFRDITERKERERRLRELREQYETVFGNTQDALFLIDVTDDGFRIARINQREEALTGLRTEEVEGKFLTEVFDEDTAAQIEARYRECLEEREPITYEEELSLPEGTRIWQTKLTPVIVDGDVTQLVGAARDITDLRGYERQLETQRDQLQLLNRIVRHDIRNDMTVVLGFGQRLRDDIDAEHRDDLDRILETSRHTVELTNTARDLVEMIRRTEEPEIQSTTLRDALTDEVENTDRSYPTATFELGDVPDVRVRANDLLSAVFRNLLHNAVQHNDSDEPRVEVTVTDTDDSVCVHVADNGSGIPDERKADIFGKEERGLDSPGTGMGLYVVDTLVDLYGGDVWVTDNEPTGSVFHVELRKADAA